MHNKVFLFPGYGSQRRTMISDIPSHDVLSCLFEGATAYTRADLYEILRDEDETRLNERAIAYPLLVLSSIAWSGLMEARDISASAVVGYGIGELAAIAHAGVISSGAALALATKMGKIVDEGIRDSDGARMMVIGLSSEEVSKVIEGQTTVWLGAENAANNTVLSGVKSSLDLLKPALLDAGAKKTMDYPGGLGALHSPMMEKVQKEVRELFSKAQRNDATIEIISCFDGVARKDGDEIISAFVDGIDSTIYFMKSLEAAVERGIKIAIECGSGSVLSGYAMRVSELTSIPVTQYADASSLDGLVERIKAIEARTY